MLFWVLLFLPLQGHLTLGMRDMAQEHTCYFRNWLCPAEIPMAEWSREMLLLRLWWSLCIPKAKLVLQPCLCWLCFDWPEHGNSYSREWDSPCLNKNVPPGQFSVFFSFQCSCRIVKMSFYSSHFIGHQSRQGIVKDSKKTLQLLCMPGETKQL